MTDDAGRGWGAVVASVLRRPRLWPTAVVQVARLAPVGWWRRRPFLPRPPPEYLAFRQLTATGSAEGTPHAADVVAWLDWCRDWPRL